MLKIKDKFQFTLNHGTLIYAAERVFPGLYEVEWGDDGYSYKELYNICAVYEHLKNGRWKVKEEVDADKRTIHINVNAVHSAASFVVLNNPFCMQDIQELIDRINYDVEKVVDKANEKWEYTFLQSSGYKVEFKPEDAKYGVVNVLVDPAIGQNSFYVNVEDYWNQN